MHTCATTLPPAAAYGSSGAFAGGALLPLVVPTQDAAGVPSEYPLSPRLALGEVLREGIQFALYRVKV
ncbi:hypothetical protein GCM10023352_17540 [Rothia endophytica]|uniref:Uncharacterized protein n=1 Tax=Rothia endophytica TaxID=1324766 RepID=A0ABP9BT91_9MICC